MASPDPMPSRTTTAILDGLAASDSDAWAQFDARYRPILTHFARRLGLGPVDAEEIAQESLSRFAIAYRKGRYQREKGRLHSWLIGIARHCILDHRAARRIPAPAGSLIDRLPSERAMTILLEEECEREILQLSLQRLRATRTEERTIRAFELLLARRPPAAVASSLNMSVEEVYLAKHRCLRRLRPIVQEIQDSFELEDT